MNLSKRSGKSESRCGFRQPSPLALSCLLILMFGACSREDPTDSSVVEPPAPANATDPLASSTDAPENEPPGSLEMPSDAELNRDSDSDDQPSSKEKKSGGFEMPKTLESDSLDSSNTTAPKLTPESSISVSYDSWEQIYEVASSGDAITIVDLWSLSCEPCLKEFPGLVRLHNAMPGRVRCMSVNLDFDGRESRPPESYSGRVSSFLESVEADGFVNYICTSPSDDVYEHLNLVSLPGVLVFDHNGEIAKLFVDAGNTAGFTYESDVIPLVADLVKGPESRRIFSGSRDRLLVSRPPADRVLAQSFTPYEMHP